MMMVVMAMDDGNHFGLILAKWGQGCQMEVVGQFEFHWKIEKFYPCLPERHLATAKRSEVESKDPKSVSSATQ